MSPGVSSLNSRPVNTGRLYVISYYVIYEMLRFFCLAYLNMSIYCTSVVRVCHLLILGDCAWFCVFCLTALSIPAASHLTLTDPTPPSGAVKRQTPDRNFHCVLGPDVSLKSCCYSLILCIVFCVCYIARLLKTDLVNSLVNSLERLIYTKCNLLKLHYIIVVQFCAKI